jgi:hypothetical protein
MEIITVNAVELQKKERNKQTNKQTKKQTHALSRKRTVF